jgi:hypothetical protein
LARGWKRRFFSRQLPQASFGWQLDVDAQAVCKPAGSGKQASAGVRHAFQVNVSVESLSPQVLHRSYQPFHSFVWTSDYTRAQEKALDVIAPVELDGHPNDFNRFEASPGNVVPGPVDTVGAIVDAVVGV